MKIGVLTDYPSIAVMSGPAIHTRFLHDGLVNRGHDVTLLGPDTRSAAPTDGVKTHLFLGVPYPTHPKVKIMMPWPVGRIWNTPKFDVLHSQANSHVLHYGVWQRQMHRTAMVATNIVHLPTHSHFIVSDSLYENSIVREVLSHSAHATERGLAGLYNQGDALIVQNRFAKEYWEQKGVTVPIEVVGRPINPDIFSSQAGTDPYPSAFRVGKRLLVVCRHDREKRLDHLIRIFVDHIAPADPDVTLTLVGDGFTHKDLVAQAEASRYADRIHFPGEVHHTRLVDWYAHGDCFVYTSLSETFGNVINEALWTGMPAVALNDRMGVAHQIVNEVNGFLIEPNRGDTEEQFTRAVLSIVREQNARQQLGQNAATIARRTSHPDIVLRRMEVIYEAAMQRAHDEVREPLSERGTLAQSRSFAHHIGAWAGWNSFLLGVANTMTRFGGSRGEIGTDATTHAPVSDFQYTGRVSVGTGPRASV